MFTPYVDVDLFERLLEREGTVISHTIFNHYRKFLQSLSTI